MPPFSLPDPVRPPKARSSFQLRLQNTALKAIIALLVPGEALLLADMCGGLLPLRATERIAYKVTLLLGYLVFHSSLVQALPSSSSCNPLLSKPCPPHLALCVCGVALLSSWGTRGAGLALTSPPPPAVYYFTVLLLLLFTSTMETVLLAALLARGNHRAQSSPGPAPRGEDPGPHPEGGQGPLPGAGVEGGIRPGAELAGCPLRAEAGDP